MFLAAALGVNPVGGEPSPAAGETPTLPTPTKLASFEDRLKAAETAKVITEILGLRVGDSLKQAHEKLDSLCAADHPPTKEEEEPGDEGESGHKVLWELAKSDYASVFVKADKDDRITYILGNLKPGREIPFTEIGQLEKAPIHTSSTVAWDVLRPGSPLMRVVGLGADERARSVTLFLVKRPPK